MPVFRFSIRTLLIVAVVCALACAIIAFGISTIASVWSHTRDAYASDWTAEFIIQHLQTSGNTWPSNWADLEDEYAFFGRDYPFSFLELQQLVNVRWDVDAATVATSDPPMRVITLLSGSDSHFQGSEPNARIRDYFATTLLLPDAKQH